MYFHKSLVTTITAGDAIFIYLRPTSISTLKRNMHTISRLQNNIRPPARELPTTTILNPLKLLQNPHNSIPHLSQRKLLPNANSRAPIERNVRPRLRRPRVPARRVEFLRVGEGFRGVGGVVRGVDVLAVLQDERRVADGGVFEVPEGPPPRGRVVSTRATRTL
jgi:hypothetical protein